MKRITALIVVGILAGCASSPPEAQWIKPGKEIANPWQQPSANSGTLIVTRDPAFVGMGCMVHAYLDGAPIGDLRVSQRITVYPSQGEHIAGVKMCANNDETSITIRSGETKKFRIAVNQSGDMKIEPTAF